MEKTVPVVKAGKKKLGGVDAPASMFALPKKAEMFVLSEESATAQVMDLLSYYDIDVDRARRSDGENNLEVACKTLVEYVRRGQVEVGRDKDARMQVTVNLSRGDEVIEFCELGARHKLVMDRVKEGGNYTRIYTLMASLAGLPPSIIEKLPVKDLSVVEILGMIFLAA